MKRAQLQQQQQQQQHANAAATASLPLVVGSRAPASPSATAVTGGGAVVTSLVDQGDNGCANSNDAGSPLMAVGGGGGGCEASNNVLRPTVEPEAADAEIIRMMTKCWAEDPLLRPDFSALKVTIRKLNR